MPIPPPSAANSSLPSLHAPACASSVVSGAAAAELAVPAVSCAAATRGACSVSWPSSAAPPALCRLYSAGAALPAGRIATPQNQAAGTASSATAAATGSAARRRRGCFLPETRSAGRPAAPGASCSASAARILASVSVIHSSLGASLPNAEI